MTSHSESALDRDLFNKPWPSLAWIVFAAAVAVLALLMAPVPT